MGKRMISIGLLIGLLFCIIPATQATELDVSAPSAILMDAATGTILWEKNAHDALPPASVTKIMALLLVMEALEGGKISWDDTVTASEAAAAKGGSQIYLEAGEQMPLRDMLKSVVVSSANDCATALAEHIAGSEAAFVAQMNRRAAELGMRETNFVNCTGLDDEPEANTHLTSAYDIAVMSRQLLQHDAIRQYTTIWMDTVRDGQFGLSNTNKLIRFYNGATGLKTGYTSAAGHCLSASAQRNGIELIAVVLHCASSTDRFTAAKALLDYGFANYTLIQLETEAIAAVPVELGTVSQLQPVPSSDTPILIDKGLQASVTQRIELVEHIAAPVEAGQKLGEIIVEANGKVLTRVALVAPDEIPRQSFWDITGRLLRHLCLNGQSLS